MSNVKQETLQSLYIVGKYMIITEYVWFVYTNHNRMKMNCNVYICT